MHLEKIRENQGSRFDRYVIGTLIIVFTFFVAQIPHTYAVIKAVGLEQLWHTRCCRYTSSPSAEHNLGAYAFSICACGRFGIGVDSLSAQHFYS
jgi:hypothetical protein